MKCTFCESEKLVHYGGFSGWDFFKKCDVCTNVDHYVVNDMQAQEGLGEPYTLISSKAEAEEELEVNDMCYKLEKAESGWKNTNGKIYEKYDRILYTAKNLLNIL